MILADIDLACAQAIERLNRGAGQRARWIHLDIRTQASAARALVDARSVRDMRARSATWGDEDRGGC